MVDLVPSECLVIEDSLAGIESAKARGDVGCRHSEHVQRREDLRHAGADAVVISLARFTPNGSPIDS